MMKIVCFCVWRSMLRLNINTRSFHLRQKKHALNFRNHWCMESWQTLLSPPRLKSKMCICRDSFAGPFVLFVLLQVKLLFINGLFWSVGVCSNLWADNPSGKTGCNDLDWRLLWHHGLCKVFLFFYSLGIFFATRKLSLPDQTTNKICLSQTSWCFH